MNFFKKLFSLFDSEAEGVLPGPVQTPRGLHRLLTAMRANGMVDVTLTPAARQVLIGELDERFYGGSHPNATDFYVRTAFGSVRIREKT